MWSSSLGIWVCAKCGRSSRGGKCRLLSKGCVGGEDWRLSEVHPSHKLFFGEQTGGSKLLFCKACGMYSEARIANLKVRCDVSRVNVTRLGNLRKGLHPASGLAFAGLERGYALGPRLHCSAPPASEAPRCALATAPVERPAAASSCCAVQGVHVSRLAELSLLESAYEAACMAPPRGQGASFTETYDDDEVVFDWDE